VAVEPCGWMNKIWVDAAGNAYVTGITDSLNFPTAHPYSKPSTGANREVTLCNCWRLMLQHFSFG